MEKRDPINEAKLKFEGGRVVYCELKDYAPEECRKSFCEYSSICLVWNKPEICKKLKGGELDER